MLTIIDPAETQALTTLETVKAELRLTSGADDDFLTSLIGQASAAVRTWCGRPFAAEGLRETLYQRGYSECIVLARWPVIAIATITAAGATLDPSGYECDFENGRLYRLDTEGNRVCWTCGRIVIDYSAGYVLPDAEGRNLPEDVERATVLIVKGAYVARLRDPLIKTEEVYGVTSTTYWVGGFGDASTLPPDVEGLLSRYRSIAVA